VGVAVQQQVQPVAQDVAQVVGVDQVLVVGRGAPHGVVVDDAQPQPAAALVVREPVGEPPQLGLTEEAVVVGVAVGLVDRRVEAGDPELQLGDLEQRPRLELGEPVALDVAIQPLEQADIGVPFRPVRRARRLVVAGALVEVRRAQLAVDVVVAGHDQQPVRRELEVVAQLLAEHRDLLELAAHAPLGEVAGQRDDVGREPVVAGQQVEVVAQPAQQGVEAARRIGEPVVLAELQIGHVQHGDRGLAAIEPRRCVRVALNPRHGRHLSQAGGAAGCRRMLRRRRSGDDPAYDQPFQ
jgi:hypothetical protein